MDKIEWVTPKLEVLSTRETAAGGGDSFDVFHTAGTSNSTLPSAGVGGTS